MSESPRRCEICNSMETPENPIGFRKINVGKWMAICRKCAELRESKGQMAEQGTFLAEYEPTAGKTPEHLSYL